MPKLVTPVSLATYAGASGFSIAGWNVAKALGAESRWIAVGVALFFAVGVQLFTEPIKLKMPWKALGYIVLLAANTAVLASVCLGINEASNPSGG
jgi:hypothetical protein